MCHVRLRRIFKERPDGQGHLKQNERKASRMLMICGSTRLKINSDAKAHQPTVNSLMNQSGVTDDRNY
jgi:hypothetical protein